MSFLRRLMNGPETEVPSEFKAPGDEEPADQADPKRHGGAADAAVAAAEYEPTPVPEYQPSEPGLPAPETFPEPPLPEPPLPEPPLPEPERPEPERPPPDPTPAPFPEPEATAHTLDEGLERTRTGFMSRLRGFLGAEETGGPSWDDVEETLIAGDVGAALAMDVVARGRRRREPGGTEAAVREELSALLVPRDGEWAPDRAVAGGPAVILVVGVNGTGKTTTIGKLAARYRREGRSVILAAADTFRAAAADQLRIWADRAGTPVVAHAPGADPGAVVYDALDAAVARGADLVIADTAGRLHTKSNLMDELTKIRRIVDKRLPGAEPETLFVLDATTGQNGLAQAAAFHEAVGLTGIVLTKLDSTSKGGIVFAIEGTLGVPVRFVGVGEGIDDLVPFDPHAFVAALFA
ncbi:MAG: signal recognition particle-docking protein FtsY [Chloroflexota bacterium]